MHPAYSVIFFTVASGAGFGLLALLGLGPLLGAPPAGAAGWGGFLLGGLLAVAGLVSSTFHLGRPERAWRAFTQWRSSWLSREGVLAVAALATTALYGGAALLLGLPSVFLGLLTTALAAATVYATAMIYAQLRTVRRWNSAWTPICYLAFAAAGGALLAAFAEAALGDAPAARAAAAPAAALMIGAWAAKLLWWRWGDAAPALSTPETATQLGGVGRVRLLEAPHTSENYLLREMGYQVARKHAEKLRAISVGVGGLAPLALMLLALGGAGPAALFLGVAVVAHLAGLVVERWLFFAEAEHAQMTFYMR